MRSIAVAPALVLALAAAPLAGCVDDIARPRITALEVTGETDFGALEVEVHLFDAIDHTFLGCAGADEGLRDVDADDVLYDNLSASFRRPDVDDRVTLGDLVGVTLEVQVIEDDADPCPSPPGPDDDVIGIADGVDVQAGTTIAFDDVVALRIVTD
ncbi:MAG TPA: hypothetical protein VHE35_22650 [Kofleriaceae bacterium]|nr:hypothetical protein [Kofleriaceae bacterium]